jgi:hypothetical protein
LFLVTLFAQDAKADSVYLDFSDCLGCSGTVNVLPGSFNSAGITLQLIHGPASDLGQIFTLVFDTSMPGPNISLIGPDGDVLTGTITAFGAGFTGTSTTSLDFTAVWSPLPSDVLSYFSPYPYGDDQGFAIYLNNGTVTSADVTITPAPEPGSLLLLSAGLLGLGLMLRRTAGALA